jgi:hypothetical protein
VTDTNPKRKGPTMTTQTTHPTPDDADGCELCGGFEQIEWHVHGGSVLTVQCPTCGDTGYLPDPEAPRGEGRCYDCNLPDNRCLG